MDGPDRRLLTKLSDPDRDTQRRRSVVIGVSLPARLTMPIRRVVDSHHLRGHCGPFECAFEAEVGRFRDVALWSTYRCG
jgi:hypothetical protein